MESFVHLRKGKTPRRLHADLDGLKDDELGRGGFTGRTRRLCSEQKLQGWCDRHRTTRMYGPATESSV